MKKIAGFIFAAALIVLGFSADSFAQNKYHIVNKRQVKQDRRIRQGIKSGELTSREVYRLDRQQNRIENTEARFRASGKSLSWRERYILEQQQDRASRSIYRQKHDKQEYPPRRKL